MRVLFFCGDRGERVVRYGLQKEDEKEWKEVGMYVSTYEQKHMCDWPANSRVAWRDPGFILDGLMKGLEPGRSNFYKAWKISGCSQLQRSEQLWPRRLWIWDQGIPS